MNKPGNNAGEKISAKVSWTDTGILLFLVEMIAEKKKATNDYNPLYTEGKLGTASVELPVSGSTILSYDNGFDKINFTTRFVFTCLKEERAYCAFKWLSSLN